MHLGKKIIFVISLFLAATSAATADERLAAAEKSYNEGQWAKAAEAYRSVLADQKKLPAAFYYNYGTAALQAGAPGEAYVALWKARLASPLDKDVRHNLQITKEKLPARVAALSPATWISWWPAEARGIPWQAWLVGAVLALLPFLWAKRKKETTAPWQWSTLIISVFFLLGGLATLWEVRSPAAGIKASTKVTSGPGKSYPEITTLEAGALVNLEEEREGWAKVRYVSPSGQETVGWVESPTVLAL